RAVRDRQERGAVPKRRTHGIAFHDAGLAATPAQARPHRSELSELKTLRFRGILASNYLYTTIQTPLNFGRRFHFASLQANGSRECAPDDRLREAIQNVNGGRTVSSLAGRNDAGRLTAAIRRAPPECAPRSGCPCESS